MPRPEHGDGATSPCDQPTRRGTSQSQTPLPLRGLLGHWTSTKPQGTGSGWGSAAEGQWALGSAAGSSRPVLALRYWRSCGERDISGGRGSSLQLQLPTPPTVCTQHHSGVSRTG